MLSEWSRCHGRRFLFVGLVLLSSILPSRTAEGVEATPLERKVKAAFLYKFTGYVQWPASSFPRPDTPITIGVAGDNRLAADLAEMVAGRTSGNRRISVLPLKARDPLPDLHILFVAGTESSRLKKWLSAVEERPALVVTESDDALELGSMINFVVSEGRVRFEISVAPAEKRGLQLSSGLLAVA